MFLAFPSLYLMSSFVVLVVRGSISISSSSSPNGSSSSSGSGSGSGSGSCCKIA